MYDISTNLHLAKRALSDPFKHVVLREHCPLARRVPLPQTALPEHASQPGVAATRPTPCLWGVGSRFQILNTRSRRTCETTTPRSPDEADQLYLEPPPDCPWPQAPPRQRLLRVAGPHTRRRSIGAPCSNVKQRRGGYDPSDGSTLERHNTALAFSRLHLCCCGGIWNGRRG